MVTYFMKGLILSVFLFFFAGLSFARQVEGNVKDPSGSPVEYANVAFLSLPDSVFTAGTRCDSIGHFSATVPDIPLMIKVAAIGFRTYCTPMDNTATSIEIVLEDTGTTLGEVVVKSKSIVRENGNAILFPTKRDKDYADGGIGVVRNMGVSELHIDPVNDDVSTISGDAVALFIDSAPASKAEVRNVRPQDIARIELLHSPSDPRFNGANVALNYILVKYETGGYSKAYAFQGFVDEKGSYSIYSKLTHKDMTYDLSAAFDYSHSRHDGYSSRTVYDFHEGEVERKAGTTSQFNKTLAPNVSFRAKYENGSMIISNTAGVSMTRIPDSWKKGTVAFSSPTYPSSAFESSSDSENKGTEWSGQYYFVLPRRFSMSVSPFLNYYHIDRNDSYINPADTRIENRISEDALQTRLRADLTKSIGRHSIGALVMGGYNDNRVDYRGSTDSDIRQKEWYVSAGVNTRLNFNNFNWRFNGWVSYQSTSLNGRRYREWLPHFYTTAAYTIDDRNSLRLSAEYSTFADGAATKSPATVYNNEIDALKGNPDLSDYSFTAASLSYNLTATDNLVLAASTRVEHFHNPTVFDFSASRHDGRPVMVRSYVNDGAFTDFSAAVTATWSAFNDRLMLQASPAYHHYAQSGMYHRHRNDFRLNAYAQLYVGRVQLSATFRKSYSVMTENYRMDVPEYYSIGAGWAYRDFYFSARANNFFNSSFRYYDMATVCGPYDSLTENFSATYHRSFSISVSYSLGYGKKTRRNDEIEAIGSANSAILK